MQTITPSVDVHSQYTYVYNELRTIYKGPFSESSINSNILLDVHKIKLILHAL